MSPLPPELLPTEVTDRATVERTIARFRDQRIVLPTFAQLAQPATMPAWAVDAAAACDPDSAEGANLWRCTWFNGADRAGRADVPVHLVLPKALTGVDAPIIVVLGRLFPMIRSHKVLAAYACLVPRLVTGGFDPTSQRAVWPSTGNYARGGVAISRLMGCRGVAVLPEGMSAARFEWLERWVSDPADIIRTPGTESNVKEIYDACNALALDDTNVILNQFSEYANHLGHYRVTGEALGLAFEAAAAGGATGTGSLRLAAFVSATGSAGTIAAGDRLKERYGSRTVAVEALECPTLLRNGYGAHNIQGIGDKHVPLIHNVFATDVVCGVSDQATDSLDVVFNTEVGRRYLAERCGVDPSIVERLGSFGLSSICNVLAAIKTAKLFGYGPSDAIITVATDGAEMYDAERAKLTAARFPGGFDTADAAAIVGEHLFGQNTSDIMELTEADRERIFNLGYFTWVEQQHIPLDHFDARRDQAFWRGLRAAVDAWDAAITEFNDRVGVAPVLGS